MASSTFSYCEKFGIKDAEDTLKKCLEAVKDPFYPGPHIVPESEVKKGVVFELWKFSSGFSAVTPALLLLKILNKEGFSADSVHTLSTKMKRVFNKQMSISGTQRTKYLDEHFALPVQSSPPVQANAESDVAAPANVENHDPRDVLSNISDAVNSKVNVETGSVEVLGGRKCQAYESIKKLNLLDYEITKKEKHSVELTKQIESLKKDKIYYDPVNVRSREASKQETIENWRAKFQKQKNEFHEEFSGCLKELKKSRNEIASLQDQILKLETELKEKDRKIANEMKMKSYYKTKQQKHCVVKRELNKIKTYTCQLENRLLESNQGANDIPDFNLRNPDGSLPDHVRLCVIALVGQEVAVAKIPSVIKVVGEHIFHVKIRDNDLPSPITVVRISDEGHYLVKLYTAEKMHSSDHFGINKDGTSRKKVKVLETSVTLSNGEQLPLGFHRTAREDSDTITKSVQDSVEELSLIQSHDSGSVDENRIAALEKLSYFMTDRAANEKKSNRQLMEWVKDELTKAELPVKPVFSIHCMAHVLLAFHKYGLESLMTFQNELTAGGTSKLGRDANGAFFRYGKENVASRVVRMTSELLGPNVDERNGIRDKWLADCGSRHVRSLIGDYRDNRFNGIFEVSAQVLHHISEILALENRLKKPLNLKVLSVLLDLKDSRVVTFVQALAIFYVKLTEPYWRLVLSKEVEYSHLPRIIQSLNEKLSLLPDNPGLLLEDDEPMIPGFLPNTASALYTTATTVRHEDRRDILLISISRIATGMKTAISNQLPAFLPGGEIASKTPDELQRLRGSGLTNLVSERNFGSLDASQKRRRHATLHYHSTILLLKTSQSKMMSWLKSKTAKERRELLKKARKHGVWLRMKHRREEIAEKKREQKELENIEAEQKRKKARKLVKNATVKKVKGQRKKDQKLMQPERKKKWCCQNVTL